MEHLSLFPPEVEDKTRAHVKFWNKTSNAKDHTGVKVPFFLLSTIFCWSHGSCPGQYKDKVICDSFCARGRIFSPPTSPISILSNTDEESAGHPFFFIFPYCFYWSFWYYYSTTLLSATLVQRLQSQVIVLWPHLRVSNSRQPFVWSTFLLHLLNHSIMASATTNATPSNMLLCKCHIIHLLQLLFKPFKV